MNTATALDSAALAAFEDILADAFAIMTGQEDLNALIEPALGLNVYRDLGTKFTRMKDLVHKLRETVEAEGPERMRVCVSAFYVGLPGNEPLRLWVVQYLPDCAGQVSEEAFRAAQVAYAEARRAGQQKLAIAGFEALHEARDQAFVAQEIARFRFKLAEAARQLRRLNGYKQLHDILHGIQTGALARFSQLLLKPALDEFDLEELSLQHGQLSIAAPRARVSIDQFLDEADVAAEERWLPLLDEAINPLANGRLDDPDTLRSVAIGVRALLRYELPRLNRALADAAGDIPFDDLSDLLRGAGERAPADSQLRGRTADAAEALDRIAAGLARMVAIHNGWQDVDNALSQMEINVRTAADRESRLELINTWRNALGPVTTLEELDAEGVGTVRQSAEGFRTVLADEAQGQTRLASAFYRYAGAVRLQFKRVDTSLLSQCVAIGKLETSLKALIEGGS